MREQELDAFRALLAAWQAVAAARAAACADIESIGLAEGDAFIAFEILEEAQAEAGELVDAVQAVVELDGVDTDFDRLEDLLEAFEDEREAFCEQVQDAFQYLVFDIEDILVDMPPLNRDRLDDDDAILYSALELAEMTEPWRNVMRLAESAIQLRLQRLERRVRELLALLDGRG